MHPRSIHDGGHPQTAWATAEAPSARFPEISGRQLASNKRASRAPRLTSAMPWAVGSAAVAGLLAAVLWWKPSNPQSTAAVAEAVPAAVESEAQGNRLPDCWRTDEGYKFIYEEGGREIHVARILEVPAPLRRSARCELDLQRSTLGGAASADRPPCWRGDAGYFFGYTTADGSEVVVQRLTDVPLGLRKRARCIKTGL